MKSILEDRTTPGQLKEAFEIIAVDKGTVTDMDLGKAQMSPETLAYLKSKMPQKNGGYDYEEFLTVVFKQ